MTRTAVFGAVSLVFACSTQSRPAAAPKAGPPAANETQRRAEPSELAAVELPEVPKEVVLERAEPLPAEAMSTLHKHMAKHGAAMENLLRSTLMLDHYSTERIAGWIGAQPRISRPLPGDDTLNSLFPERFFALQDEMHAAVDALADAADAADDLAVARAYSRLSESCVSCHSVYLRMPTRMVSPEEAD